MPAVLRAPRSQWIAAASQALGHEGVAAVRVETLASTMGVTKGSFYAHFASRAELLHAVLDDWERRSTDEVLSKVESLGAEPSAKIRMAGLLSFEDDLHRIDLAIRDWARTDAEVQTRLRRVDEARMDYLRSQFRHLVKDPDEIEARSALAFTFALGRHFLPDSIDVTGNHSVMRGVGRLLGVGY